MVDRLADLYYGALSKRKVFVSYHHGGDQAYYDAFTRIFADRYEIFTDNSLERRIGSDDIDYVHRRIREEHISGTSITIVLCGADTFKRKYVDWEIHSTLHCEHALMGIVLPSAQVNASGAYLVPDRLATNVQAGYALWVRWTTDPNEVRAAIERAIALSSSKWKIDNSQPQMSRNIT